MSKASIYPKTRNMGKKHPCVVYYISDKQYIKVGKTTNLENRMSALQHAHSKPLELLGINFDGDSLEPELHKRFAHLRKAGEWFLATKELVRYIDANAIHNQWSSDLVDKYLKWLETNASYEDWLKCSHSHIEKSMRYLSSLPPPTDLDTDYLRWRAERFQPHWAEEYKKMTQELFGKEGDPNKFLEFLGAIGKREWFLTQRPIVQLTNIQTNLLELKIDLDERLNGLSKQLSLF